MSPVQPKSHLFVSYRCNLHPWYALLDWSQQQACDLLIFANSEDNRCETHCLKVLSNVKTWFCDRLYIRDEQTFLRLGNLVAIHILARIKGLKCIKHCSCLNQGTICSPHFWISLCSFITMSWWFDRFNKGGIQNVGPQEWPIDQQAVIL